MNDLIPNLMSLIKGTCKDVPDDLELQIHELVGNKVSYLQSQIDVAEMTLKNIAEDSWEYYSGDSVPNIIREFKQNARNKLKEKNLWNQNI
jgi:hypothetical protein